MICAFKTFFVYPCADMKWVSGMICAFKNA